MAILEALVAEALEAQAKELVTAYVALDSARTAADQCDVDCQEKAAEIERLRAQLVAVTERDWEALGHSAIKALERFDQQSPLRDGELWAAFPGVMAKWLRSTFGSNP